MTTSTTSPGEAQRPLLQQAPVVPLDASGFTAALVGTALFVVATAVCWFLGYRGQVIVILVTTIGFGVFLTAFTACHKWCRRPSRPAPPSPDAQTPPTPETPLTPQAA